MYALMAYLPGSTSVIDINRDRAVLERHLLERQLGGYEAEYEIIEARTYADVAGAAVEFLPRETTQYDRGGFHWHAYLPGFEFHGWSHTHTKARRTIREWAANKKGK
jgi:hypothetical protein